MDDRFRFRAWSFVERTYYYDAEATYDFLNGIDCDSFNELLNNDKFIVEQSTGIKDCHGKLIYEGDLIRLVQDGEIRYQGVVEWFSAGGTFCGGWIAVDYSPKDKRNTASHIFYNQWEVYGNIHETEIE